MSDGTTWVKVRIFGASGERVSFLPAQGAVNVGEKLAETGKAAAGRLVVPGPGTQLPPMQLPNGGGVS
jgi:hypothetical protein